MSGTNTTTSIRLLDAREELEAGAALEGVSRSEFIRRAVRQRAARLRRETEEITEEED